MTLLQEALAPRSDQLNADDLIPGPRTIKITGARIVEGDRGGKRVTIHYEGENGKPWKACKTMGRAMVMVWGIVDDEDEAKISAQFAGKSVTIYRDPKVDFGNEKGIGGIRISHMSHIDGPRTVKLTVSQGKKSQFVFQPLTAEVRQLPGATDDLGAWAHKFIENVGKAPDLDRLNAYAEKAQARLDALATAIPEAHEACMSALNNKRVSFALADDDEDPFSGGPEGDGSGGEEG
jgi:hypothetical protein